MRKIFKWPIGFGLFVSLFSLAYFVILFSIATVIYLAQKEANKEAKPKQPAKIIAQSRPIIVKNPPIATKEDMNIFYFKTKVFPLIRKEECGKCEELCHFDKNDRGGITCSGISIRHNAQFFVKELNSFSSACRPRGNGIYCERGIFDIDIKELYYRKYAKKFIGCDKKAFAMIVDSSVLSGMGTATKLLQKSAGLKKDGIFGAKSLKACQKNFNGKLFTKLRIDRFVTLKQCNLYCKGWSKRALRKLKQYQGEVK